MKLHKKKQSTEAVSEKKRRTLLLISAAVLAFAVILLFLLQAVKPGKNHAHVVSISALEKIIQVSELSTFTAVYNGIAEVKNEKKPEQIDYYVSYEAKVNAGIDFKKVKLSVDKQEKIISVTLPEIFLTDISADIASLDFIFCNKKSNTSTVTQEAYKACEADVREEAGRQTAILELAKQNAANIITALVRPIIEQSEEDYQLMVH